MYVFKPHVFTEHSPHSIAKPLGRMKSKIRCDGKNLYIYSGEDPNSVEHRDESGNILFFTSKPEFRDIWVYNLARQQWRLMTIDSNLPDSNDFICGTIFELNYLVICTIQRPSNLEPSSRNCRLHICDLNTKSVLVQGTTGQIPSPTFANNLIRHGKYYYTVGITRIDEDFSDVYKLNTENGVWEVDYICRKRDYYRQDSKSSHTLVYGNNMIYIFDGDTDDSAFDVFSFVRCWKMLDTHGDENHIPQYPTERKDIGVTSYTDPDSEEINVIISGGTNCDDNALNDVWRLNLTSLKWTCLERFGTVLPCHIDSHSMKVSPAGKLFTFGGYIFNNDTQQGLCLSTLHSSWLRIPKLTDICWEAVFHYYPGLKSMTDKEIKSLGIPPHFLKSRIN
ncbi:kelch domain-containing protein 10 homolog [Microplitis mediator]|uniref:kelch domain-containing protein 10 homolog n=1 Tax=Microplitis mediator TaxID=375433 RepID=UPI002556F55A|nr:kelch domain-containing protein 10 homolog [Microplitis mediator]